MFRLTLIFTLVLSVAVSAQTLKLVLPMGHTGRISLISYNKDGSYILTASDDRTAKLWHTTTGTLLAEVILKNPDAWFRAAGFVPGDRYLFSSSDSVRISTLNGEPHFTVDGRLPERSSNSFTPDGSMLITYDWDSVFLWQLQAGRKVAAYHMKDIRTASFSPDGKRFITGDAKGRVVISNTANGTVIDSFRVTEGGGVFDAVYSPDGNHILVTNGNVSLWDCREKALKVLMRYKDTYAVGGFSPDSKFLIATDKRAWGDTSARIWNVSTGTLLGEVKEKFNYFTVSGSNFSPDGKYLVMPGNSQYNETNIYQLPELTLFKTISGHTSSVNYAAWHPVGKMFATASSDKTAIQYDGNSFLLANTLAARSIGGITGVRFSPDQKYFTLDYLSSSTIWNTKDGTLAANFQEWDNELPVVEFSPDGRNMLAIAKTGRVRLWDTDKGSLLVPDLKEHIPNVYVNYQGNFGYTANGEKIFLANHDQEAFLFAAKTGQLLTRLPQGYFIDVAGIDTEGKTAAILSRDTLKIWDAITGRLTEQFLPGEELNPDSIVFVSSGKQVLLFYLEFVKCYNLNGKLLYKIPLKNSFTLINNAANLIVAERDKLMIYDTKNGNKIAEHKDSELDPYADFRFVTKGNLLAYKCNYSIKLVDINTKKIVSTFNTLFMKSNHTAGCVAFDEAGKRVAIGYLDGIIRTWDINSSAVLSELRQHDRPVNNVYFLPGKDKLLSVSRDNTARVWDLMSGKEKYRFFTLNAKDYYIQTPDKFYWCTPAAAKLLHYVTPGLGIISFEQLDVKYNRPDKVLEAIGSTDTALIRSYRKAYEKRIKKLGIDTTAFRDGYSVPEADFANRDNIEFEQKNDKLKLDFKSVDSAYKLDRFNVWVNETPLYGQRGISLRNKNLNNFDSTVTINLSQGKNRIETSITNVNGTESYHMPLLVNYKPLDKQTEQTHFIGIGIDKFADSKYNLNYSTKDIRDLCKKLKEKYKDIIIDTLFNQNVTISKVKALKQKLLQTSVNDKVIISYSGHGMLSKDFDYFLSTYAVNFDKPEEN